MSDFEVSEWYESGSVRIVSARDPLSLQANAARKARLKADLANAVAAATMGVFIGDVEVTIEWFVPETYRYGTHMVADLDNIMKPLLDAVTGPGGVLIDDNQVQSLRISWLEPYLPSVKFHLAVEATSPDEYWPREGLFFVEFSQKRCFPVRLGWPPEAVRLVVRAADERFRVQQELVAAGMPEEEAYALRPIQRFFPRSRLHGFVIRPSVV